MDYLACLPCKNYISLEGPTSELSCFRHDVIISWVMKWQGVIIRHFLHLLKMEASSRQCETIYIFARLKLGKHVLKIFFFLIGESGRIHGFFIFHNQKTALSIQNEEKGKQHSRQANGRPKSIEMRAMWLLWPSSRRKTHTSAYEK